MAALAMWDTRICGSRGKEMHLWLLLENCIC
ncbi:hypothetical protein T01_639 [Trichinella spiralis]|uniref:Uncharacterized protein n=1 Tax=Trichinella spiralis TaxID=6334 RepID=A0A0V1AM70_TRISP|nr:hypothetical protein T01_13630 [Trichinella spiralis]KRY25931.1 hypothetical protein T01_639 [Trichinella spiralis]